MQRKKSWLLVLGMTMLMGWGTVTAQASPRDFEHTPIMHTEAETYEHQPDFRQTPEEHRKLLALLHIDEDTYNAETRHGRSLAEIAGRHHVAPDRVSGLMEDQMRARIDRDERAHRISPQQAWEMKRHTRERAEGMLRGGPQNHDGPPEHDRFDR